MSNNPDKRLTLTRHNLVEKLRQELGNATLARDLVNSFFAEAESSLLTDGRLKLHNFGTFETNSKAERLGRNPLSGEEMKITARRVIKFRPSNKLRDAVRRTIAPAPGAADG